MRHLTTLGGCVFDRTWTPIVKNKADVAAANVLKTFMDCIPEGAQTFRSPEAAVSFMQGSPDMAAIALAADFEDPDKSKVAGNVGWIQYPEGVLPGSRSVAFYVGISKHALFLLILWPNSKAGDLLTAITGGAPCRFPPSRTRS